MTHMYVCSDVLGDPAPNPESSIFHLDKLFPLNFKGILRGPSEGILRGPADPPRIGKRRNPHTCEGKKVNPSKIMVYHEIH